LFHSSTSKANFERFPAFKGLPISLLSVPPGTSEELTMSQRVSADPVHTESARSQPRQLEGRTVVIFGGTSGIGVATAIQAKAAGAKIIVIGRERDRAQQAATENGFDGWHAADVTRNETIYEALANIPHVDHLSWIGSRC
jgi:NADPH:quinone reductase-like Zn-dependent oxidoreductase